MEPALNNKAFLLIPMTLFFLKKKLIVDFAVKEQLAMAKLPDEP